MIHLSVIKNLQAEPTPKLRWLRNNYANNLARANKGWLPWMTELWAHMHTVAEVELNKRQNPQTTNL